MASKYHAAILAATIASSTTNNNNGHQSLLFASALKNNNETARQLGKSGKSSSSSNDHGGGWYSGHSHHHGPPPPPWWGSSSSSSSSGKSGKSSSKSSKSSGKSGKSSEAKEVMWGHDGWGHSHGHSHGHDHGRWKDSSSSSGKSGKSSGKSSKSSSSSHDGWHSGGWKESSSSGKSGKGSKSSKSSGKSSKSSGKSGKSSSSSADGKWVWVEVDDDAWGHGGWSGSGSSGKSGKSGSGSGSGKSGKSGSGSGDYSHNEILDDDDWHGSKNDDDGSWNDDGHDDNKNNDDDHKEGWSSTDDDNNDDDHNDGWSGGFVKPSNNSPWNDDTKDPYDGQAWKGDTWNDHTYDPDNYGYFAQGGIDNHVTDICHASCDDNNVCTFNMKVDLYQSEFGFFTFEECDSDLFMPTIGMEVGKTYRFVQTDRTNYFHPVGFAYYPDGALAGLDEIDEFTAPPGTDSNCAEDNSCPSPTYLLNGEDIGLDEYEPKMAHPIHDWANYGTFMAELNFPEDTGYDADLFYFCHIHQYLGGRIKLLKNGKPLQPKIHLPIHTVYLEPPSTYDMECGTYGLEDFQLPHPECPHRFICNDASTDNISLFASCIESMNCHMFAKMTTNANSGSEVALFIHQMIPHHQNAVNMAKSLLKLWDEKCPDIRLQDTDDCVMEGMLREIVNAQNGQIQIMRDLLKSNRWPLTDDCTVKMSSHEAGSMFGDDSYRQRALASPTPESATSVRDMEERRTNSDDGICRASCSTNKNGKEICTFTAVLDLFATELGAFQFKECGDAVYPTLGMEIGKTYVFVQEDRSNYYHPLGFAYYADGAHDDKDEVEDVVVPPGSSSGCDADASCPSPKYYLDDEEIGLDEYEPKFFHSPGEWVDYGTFTAELTFDIDDYNKDLFYFCHIHQFMSGRIKLLKDDEPVQYNDSPALPYKHEGPSDYDQQCGSFGMSEFQLPHPECPSKFVCSAGSGSLGKFAECIETQNCFMMTGMTTYVDDKYDGDVALFNRHMIPHHQNAVNMAKSLLTFGGISCSNLSDDTDDCAMERIIREIINNQNFQIQLMRGVLENDGFPETNDCKVLVSNSNLRG